jgi:hypothetical protein
MKPSLLKYSAWISLLLLTATSCRSVMVSHPGEQAEKMRESFLSGSFEKITCKAKVTFHENELSGLMLIKKTPDRNYRLAFYNELGMTYLEGLFVKKENHAKFTVKNIMPVINHKAFVKSLEKSLQIIFSSDYNNQRFIDGNGFPAEKLIVREHNGFALELSPQIIRMNSD